MKRRAMRAGAAAGTGRAATVTGSGRPVRWPLALATLAMALGLSGCLGCGGDSYIRTSLERAGDLKQPVWVGVYYLTKESALDGIANADLTNREKANAKLAGNAGVTANSEIKPVYPGDPAIVLNLVKPDPAIGWVVIVANFPNPEPCARQVIPVKKGDSLNLTISVDASCLTVKKK